MMRIGSRVGSVTYAGADFSHLMHCNCVGRRTDCESDAAQTGAIGGKRGMRGQPAPCYLLSYHQGAGIMNRKQIRGAARSIVGDMEQMTGKLIGNWNLQRRGIARKMSGKTEALAGNAMETIKAALRRH